jgi:hypothetical protein
MLYATCIVPCKLKRKKLKKKLIIEKAAYGNRGSCSGAMHEIEVDGSGSASREWRSGEMEKWEMNGEASEV